MFKFTEAVSLIVNCENQEEIDLYWDKLTASGGTPVECDWLKDQFGLSWQITPSILPQLLTDSRKTGRVMQALMSMKKLDIATLQAAHDQV